MSEIDREESKSSFVRTTARNSDLKVHPDVGSVAVPVPTREMVQPPGMDTSNSCCCLNLFYNPVSYSKDDFNFAVADGREGDVVRHRSTVKVWYVWYNCCHEELVETQESFYSADSGKEILFSQANAIFDTSRYVSVRIEKCHKRHEMPVVRTILNRCVWSCFTTEGIKSTAIKLFLCRNPLERAVVHTVKCESTYFLSKIKRQATPGKPVGV